MSAITGVDHIALTISDLGRSSEWYQEVFGLVKIAAVEEAEGERRKVILRHPGTGLRIGLVEHRTSPSEPFDETALVSITSVLKLRVVLSSRRCSSASSNSVHITHPLPRVLPGRWSSSSATRTTSSLNSSSDRPHRPV